MAYILSLDLGTTKLAALAFDVATGRALAITSAPNRARRDTVAQGLTRAELDASLLSADALALLRELVTWLPDDSDVLAVGVTGQQHGVAFLDAQGRPTGTAITWQDQRALEPAGSGTFLDEYISRAGGPERFAGEGCQPAPGYLGVTLYWLAQHDLLPANTHICHIPDVFVATLIGKLPPTDPTLAGSSGLYDVQAGGWDRVLIRQLGLSTVQFPEVKPTGSLAGTLCAEAASFTGLRAGTPVAVALGDNQASYIGSVTAPWDSVLVNIGTGGQVSALVNTFLRVPTVDTRAFPEGSFLLVGAGSSGGSSLTALHTLVQEIGQEFWGIPPANLYGQLTTLASQAPVGAAGVTCIPHFGGTRANPADTGSWFGLTTANLTISNLTRALLEGIASDANAFWRAMAPLTGPRARLIGAGNGLLRNPVLQGAIEDAFGLPLTLSRHAEAAALGAALSASVAAGVYPDHVTAMSQNGREE